MRFARLRFVASIVVLSLGLMPDLSGAIQLETDGHELSSSLVVTIFLGDASGPAAAILSQVFVDGTAKIKVVQGPGGAQSVDFESVEIRLPSLDIPQIPVGTAGTFDLELDNLVLSLSTPEIGVTNDEWNLSTSSVPGAIALVGGRFEIDAVTGELLDLGDSLAITFSDEPLAQLVPDSLAVEAPRMLGTVIGSSGAGVFDAELNIDELFVQYAVLVPESGRIVVQIDGEVHFMSSQPPSVPVLSLGALACLAILATSVALATTVTADWRDTFDFLPRRY